MPQMRMRLLQPRALYRAWEEIMNRRTAFVSLAVLTLVVFAFPQASFAQSGSMIGTWKLNLEKSKYPPGTAPRSQTNVYQQDGQNIKGTVQAVNAEGNATTTVL